jgi:hypothetical protein
MKNRIRSGTTLFLGALLSGMTFVPSLSSADDSNPCRESRQLVQKKGGTFYKVSERASTLYMISRDLYGDENDWTRIAEWNGLKKPYTLRLGQLLAIHTEPKLDEVEGTRALISGWSSVSHRGKFRESSKSRVEALEACLPKKIEPAPVVVAPSPIPLPLLPPLSPPRAEPTAERIAEIEEEAYGHSHARWGGSLKLTGSLFNLNSVEEALATETKAKSDWNYGVELGIERHFNEKWSLGVGAGIERIRMKELSDAVLIGRDQNFLKFALEIEYEVAEPFSLSLGGAYVQRPFVETTFEGPTLERLYIPELSLGAHLRFFDTQRAAGWIVGEGTYAFDTHDRGHHLKADWGYSGGLRFDFKLNGSMISLSPTYRMLKVGSDEAENKQEAFLVSLGWHW